MERMMPSGAAAAWATQRAVRALSRRFGAWGWSMLACCALALLAAVVLQYQLTATAVLRARLAGRNTAAVPAPAAAAPADAGARARLRAFEQHLLAHDEIPFAVAALMAEAGQEGLTVQRGEYRPQADRQGGFLRYRMALPVTGAAPAVQRFILAALRKHPSLALESAQFKRAQSGAADVEARIQWVMLSRLPVRAAGADDGAVP